MSISRLIADFQTALETIFSCEPVSIIAVIGFPLHSSRNLINTPQVHVINEVATSGFPDLNFMDSFSNADNSLDTPSTSPT